MNQKKEIKADEYLYCMRCDKMICPGNDMILELDEKNNIVGKFCISCGKGHPLGTLIY